MNVLVAVVLVLFGLPVLVMAWAFAFMLLSEAWRGRL